MKTLWFASCLVVVVAGIAQGAPIAYEGVEYPASPLGGHGPALGFALPWAADPNVAVVAGGLSSALDLPAHGNTVAGFFDFVDPLINTIAPTPGKEFWASVLIFHFGPNDQTFMGLAPAGAPLGSLPSVAIGVRLGQYGIFEGAAFTPSGVPFTVAGSTDFLVAQFVAGGATWNVSLWVNRLPFGVPDLVRNVAPVVYGTMLNQNQAEFESDEFRLGDLASDVSAAGVVPTLQTTWGRLKARFR
jgi:hypothetical protein